MYLFIVGFCVGCIVGGTAVYFALRCILNKELSNLAQELLDELDKI